MVVAATTTLALRGRRREFALLRAVGATRGQVRRLVATELALLSAVAAPLGGLPGLALARWLDPALVDAAIVEPGFRSTLSPLPVLGAVALVLPTAVLAGLLAARETVRAAPTAAVRESAAETAPVGPVRRVASLVCAIGGVSVAATPLVVPGTVGAALAATSAFLLVGAAALAGPLLVAWTFDRTARLTARRGGAPTRLALVNLRGFSRRLTTVVVPLALVVAVGTVQTTVDTALQRATTQQLGAAIGTPRVATSAAGLSGQQLATLAAAPGVDAVVTVADAPAELQTDADVPDSLGWEATTLRAVDPAVEPALLDPDVTEGSLGDLAGTDTVAISSDTAFDAGRGLGDRLRVRLDGHDATLRVVAVFDRGLGVGGELVSPATLAAHDVTPVVRLALVDGPAADAVPGTVPTADFVASATSPDAGSQHLSTLLTLLLLGFVALGSLNALLLLTAGRRDELRLLHRTGATARQLRRTVGVEAVVTAAAAWAVGTAAVVPAVVGVSAGLLGASAPALDLPAYAALSASVVTLAIATVLLTAVRIVRAATTTGDAR
nr:FtsX-like permease family protein [Nocardioides flavescens]